MLNDFFIIFVTNENAVVNSTLAIPTGATAIVALETIQTPPVSAERIINILSM